MQLQSSTKCLTIVDDFTRGCLHIAVDYGISGGYVARVLGAVGQFRGLPRLFVPTRGRNSRGGRWFDGPMTCGVDLKLIAAGKPTQNAYIESFG
jgi:putative transposase